MDYTRQCRPAKAVQGMQPLRRLYSYKTLKATVQDKVPCQIPSTTDNLSQALNHARNARRSCARRNCGCKNVPRPACCHDCTPSRNLVSRLSSLSQPFNIWNRNQADGHCLVSKRFALLQAVPTRTCRSHSILASKVSKGPRSQNDPDIDMHAPKRPKTKISRPAAESRHLGRGVRGEEVVPKTDIC